MCSSVDPIGSRWVLMVPCRSRWNGWVQMGPVVKYGFQWVLIGPVSYLWVLLKVKGPDELGMSWLVPMVQVNPYGSR